MQIFSKNLRADQLLSIKYEGDQHLKCLRGWKLTKEYTSMAIKIMCHPLRKYIINF